MTSKKHKKHAYLAKPKGGKYGRNEFGIIGAPCGIIQKLSKDLGDLLEDSYRVGYMDAAHNNDEPSPAYHTAYRDNIDHHVLTFSHNHPDFGLKPSFNSADLILVNGNHFLAEKQIVLINEKKKASLEKKLDRLKDVLLFVLDEGQTEVHPFLKDHLDHFNNIPVISIKDVKGIAKVIGEEMRKHSPAIKALVLAGGASTRMGNDKGAINYHGKPQREYMADLLSNYAKETYLSVQGADQGIESNYELLPDSFRDLGPFGGILSAFRKDPNSAWLVTATDIPLLDDKSLKVLVEKRDLSKLATCFHNPETNFPEPLITIWEPRAYPVLLQFLANGYSCPRKVLINSDIAELEIDRIEVLSNVNTPEELAAIMPKVNG